MKSLWLTLLMIHCSFTAVFPQTGWNALNSGTDINLSRIQFVNSQTGWAGGFQPLPTRIILIKTTNAGASWFSQTENFPTGNRILSLFFINSETGWVSGAEGVFKTTNGGDNFFAVSVYPTNDCYFADALTGWITCIPDSPPMLKTTDGGNTWTPQSVNIIPNDQLYSLHFENSLTGWAAGSSYIFKTTNGGTNWISQSHPSFSCNQIFAVSPDYAWVAANNRILSTTNGGTNWFSISSENTRSVYFVNSSTGFAVTGSQILKTTNSEVNWSSQSANSFNNIFFTSPDTGYVWGPGGVIYKTTNGGVVIGINMINETKPENYRLYQNYPNPFNPTTKIQLDVPGVKQASLLVTLKVHDITGKEICTLVSDRLQPGSYETSFDGSTLNSGVYFYKLSADNFTETKKMLLIK